MTEENEKDFFILDLQEQLILERIRLLDAQTKLMLYELEEIRIKIAEIEKVPE